ncbi:tetratricopeptide repeat protein [Nonomuraea sp. NPDC048916]|uniref:tetratricopeptide repeat protein n=1 Tax=Nonomuraea sp. NPDC048916 TaxID=3154232 RepID=UPI00340AD4E4
MSGADASPLSRLSAQELGSALAAAEAALQAGDLATARSHATTIADQSRSRGLQRRFGGAYRLLGRIARADGDVESAERAFRTALLAFTLLEDGCAAAHVLTEMAQTRLSAGHFGAATDLSRQAVQRAPGDVQALTVLGYAQWLSGSPADGASAFEQALHINRDAAPALAGRGQIRADLGDHQGALADLGRALALGLPPSDEADVRSARALAIAGLGDIDAAEAELARALMLAPDRVRTRLRRARVRALTGDVEQALRDLEEIRFSDAPPVEKATARRALTGLRQTLSP